MAFDPEFDSSRGILYNLKELRMEFLTNFLTPLFTKLSAVFSGTLNVVLRYLKLQRFGKYITYAFLLAVISTVGNFFKLGIVTSISMLRGVANDPSLSNAGGVLTWLSQSVQPAFAHLRDLLPDFWRFLGWWCGLDWLLWAFVCAVLFTFCGWILSILVKALSLVVGMVLKWL